MTDELKITILRQDDCRPFGGPAYGVIYYQVRIPRAVYQYLPAEVRARFVEEYEDELVCGDHAADNYAVRGLLLELLLVENPGITDKDNYRACLLEALEPLWD